MYIVIYNRRYKRQFEAVVPKEDWDKANQEYGTIGAVVKLVKKSVLKKKGRRATSKKAKSFVHFVEGTFVRPDIYGEATVKVGNTKKEVMDRGLGEYYMSSTRKILKAYHIHPRNRRRLYGY